MADFTLAVLAGGAGSRMGAPKSRLEVGGSPILDFLLQRLQWRGPTMLVTAPGVEKPSGADRFDREVSDPVAGRGPLRGVLTALENAETDIVVIATVDMPGVTGAQLQWVGDQLGDRLGIMIARSCPVAATPVSPLTRGGDAGVAATEESIEPFPSAWRRSAAPVIAANLAQNRRAVHGLAKIDGFETIAVPRQWPADTWVNLNTPDDLREFEGRLEKR